MDLYTLIVVGDERSPVRRFQVPKPLVHRAVVLVAVAALIGLAATWDYWRLRSENGELPELRATTSEQAAEIRRFQRALERVEGELARVQELERKVRIIANVPGTTAAGGSDVTQLPPPVADGEAPLPTGVPAPPPGAWDASTGGEAQGGRGGPEPGEAVFDAQELSAAGERPPFFEQMLERADALGELAHGRSESLDSLMDALEEKRKKLASMPSVWPVRGWVTSRFGPRISPFTGRRHMHSGIDIATREGTPIRAPARGRVAFVGRKGPLGNSVVLDHGFGVRTFYGHTSAIHVKTGDRVERGQEIAAVGSTGRSTGPHLHYTIEIRGKARDPLDYILD